MNGFFKDNNAFVNYTAEHYLSVIIFLIIGIVFILIGKYKLKGNQKYSFIVLILSFVFFFQVIKIFVMQYKGVFDIKTDIPLHLCNMSPLFLLLAYYFRSRLAWSIFFLWIMSGTFQSLITPTLHQSFPNYEWWRYWIIHAWLVTGAFYGIFVFGYKMRFKDIFKALLWLNVLAFVVFLINTQLGSNYMYMQGKPEGKTLYNALLDWPYYIIQLEFLAIFFFSLIYLPFYFMSKKVK